MGEQGGGQKLEETKVVFRKFKDSGEIIAIFPQVPGDRDWWTCLSYMWDGHSSCDPQGLVSVTSLATEEEYRDTKRYLEGIGYNLRVMSRITGEDGQIRRAKLKGAGV